MRTTLAPALAVACLVATSPDLRGQIAVPRNRQPFSAAECLRQNGLVYGPFRDGQSPDASRFPTETQIDEDLAFIRRLTTRIRTYSASGALASIPRLAQKHGLRVAQGIALGADADANRRELESGLALATTGSVDFLIVGNEVLTAGSLSKQDLISYLRQARRAVPGYMKITTGETWDKWMSNPELVREVDFVLAHFYPFWENLSISEAPSAAIDRYFALVRALNPSSDRRRPPTTEIVIGETGWPSAGAAPFPRSIPGAQNQRQFLEQFLSLACGRSIPFYFFSAFDEEFKWQEGASSRLDPTQLPRDRNFSGRYVGSSWGLFRSDGVLKTHLGGLFDQPAPGTRRNRDILVNGQLSAFYDLGVDSSSLRRDWLRSGEEHLTMAYPAGQDWGAVFVTVGEPKDLPRPWKDFSQFRYLSVDLRGESGGEVVEVGIKDYLAPDDGSEPKVRLTLDREYRRYEIPLSRFASRRFVVPDDLTRLYVVTEFVFEGTRARTVHVRNISFVADQ